MMTSDDADDDRWLRMKRRRRLRTAAEKERERKEEEEKEEEEREEKEKDDERVGWQEDNQTFHPRSSRRASHSSAPHSTHRKLTARERRSGRRQTEEDQEEKLEEEEEQVREDQQEKEEEEDEEEKDKEEKPTRRRTKRRTAEEEEEEEEVPKKKRKKSKNTPHPRRKQKVVQQEEKSLFLQSWLRRPSPASLWICSVCTLENEGETSACRLCETVRPPRPPSPFSPSPSSSVSSVDLTVDADNDNDDFVFLSPSPPPSRLQRVTDGLDLAVERTDLREWGAKRRKREGREDELSSDMPTHFAAAASSSLSWSDKYTPSSLSSLAVHPRKVAEVRRWLEKCSGAEGQQPADSQSLLCLAGPPGCGKRTMVKLLAAELHLSLSTWEGEGRGQWRSTLEEWRLEGGSRQDSQHSDSSLSSFCSFLLRALRYAPLAQGKPQEGQKRIVLLHACDLPGAGRSGSGEESEMRQAVSSALRNALDFSKFCAVLLVTHSGEDSSHWDLHQTLDEALLSSPRVAHVECNPITAGNMRKALHFIIKKEGLNLSETALSAIIASSKGDLHHAIESLQFEVAEAEGGEGREKKRTRKELQSVLSSGRDASFSLFHSVGKVLFGKGNQNVEEIIERCSVPPLTLLSFVQQNLIRHLLTDDQLIHIQQALEACSEADVLSKAASLRFGDTMSGLSDQLPAIIACRGFLLAKRSLESSFSSLTDRPPQQHPFAPIKGGESKKAEASAAERRRQVREMVNSLTDVSLSSMRSFPSSSSYWTETLPFLGLIQSHTPQQQQPQINLHNTHGDGQLQSVGGNDKNKWVGGGQSALRDVQSAAVEESADVKDEDEIEDVD